MITFFSEIESIPFDLPGKKIKIFVKLCRESRMCGTYFHMMSEIFGDFFELSGNFCTSDAPYASRQKEKNLSRKAILGGHEELKCNFLGKPDVDVAWFKNGKSLPRVPDFQPGKRSTYTLDDIRSEDAGNYTCTASNVFGNISRTFSVEVDSQYHDIRTTITSTSNPSYNSTCNCFFRMFFPSSLHPGDAQDCQCHITRPDGAQRRSPAGMHCGKLPDCPLHQGTFNTPPLFPL